MMMSGPALVSMAEAIRGFRSVILIRSTLTSTPASLPNSAASRLNSTSEAGTKLTHSRMLSLVPFGKLGAFCAATISGIPPTAAAPVAAPATLRNARRSSLVTPPGFAIVHPRRTGPLSRSPTDPRPNLRNAGDHNTAYRRCQALFAHRSRAGEALQCPLAGGSRFCASVQPLLAPRAPTGGPGKAVRIRRDPVTVIGDETRESHWRESREGAGSRTIREPGDLPGRVPPSTGLRGRT